MGILSSMFNKMGHWHIRQLVKECTKTIISASMRDPAPRSNPHLTDSALNFLILHGGYNIMEGKPYASLKEKFSEYVRFYIVHNLGREIDYESGESVTRDEEIAKYWPNFMTTKDGTHQQIKVQGMESRKGIDIKPLNQGTEKFAVLTQQFEDGDIDEEEYQKRLGVLASHCSVPVEILFKQFEEGELDWDKYQEQLKGLLFPSSLNK